MELYYFTTRKEGYTISGLGIAMFYDYFKEFLLSRFLIVYPTREVLNYGSYLFGAIAVVFTVHYLIRPPKSLHPYHRTLKIIWIALLVSLSLINIIQYNVLQEVNFELQHPVFMVLIAFATIITGTILRYWPTIAGGVIFAVLAYVSSLLPLHDQMLTEAVGWIVAFIIPGFFISIKRFYFSF